MWANKHRRIFFIILPILFIHILSIDISAKDLNERQTIVLSKTVMSPIHIRNDSDLIRQAQQNGWPGNGSPTNPYLIKDYYIDSVFGPYCIWIENTTLYVSIVNCSLQYAYSGVFPFGSAIALSNASNVIAENNTIYSCGIGIFLQNSYSCIIKSNKISWCNFGIDVIFSREISIISNFIDGADEGGVCIRFSENNLIKENTLLGCGIVLEGDISTWTSQLIDSSNKVNGKPVLYKVSAIGETITGTYGQIIIVNSSNVVVRDIEISETTIGLQIGFSNSITIQNCSFYRNMVAGVSLTNTMSSVVRSITLRENNNGIVLYNSNANRIYENGIYRHGCGLKLILSSGNKIYSNYIYESSVVGIYLVESSNNEIFSNVILGNIGYGVAIKENSNANRIYENRIYGHEYGLILILSSGNKIYSNYIDKSSEVGIYLVESSNNEIFSNIIDRNIIYGIAIKENSNANRIYENEINGRECCLILILSSGNKIYSNNITGALKFGIYLVKSSNNEIFSNRILRNMEYGVAIEENSTQNMIYRNIFIDNAQYKKGLIGRSQAFDSVGGNLWFIESSREGNYWSNWDGSGWGTPEAYPIDGGAGAYDKYPLSSPTPEISYIFIVLAVAVIIISKLRPLKHLF